MSLSLNGVRPASSSITVPSASRWRGAGRTAGARVQAAARNAAPLAVVLVVLFGMWEIVASRPGSSLPPPSTVWTTSYDLITDPFFDRGGLDKGLFWHLFASLQRVALGFLLSLAMARPAPFYLLDEVEAALDDVNLGRFLSVVARLAERTQFILITHQQPTVEAADILFGVTMGAEGVSQVVARRLSRDVEGPAQPYVRRALRATCGPSTLVLSRP